MRKTIWLVLTLGLFSACGPKPGNTPEGGEDGGTSDVPGANIPEAYLGMQGTYMDPKTLEVIIFRPSANAPSPGYEVLYSNGRKPFFPVSVVDYGISEGGGPYFIVTFPNDSKQYKLAMGQGLGQFIECTNPDGSVQNFHHITLETRTDFRPNQAMRDYLRGTFADTHSGELLMFTPSGKVYYSNGTDAFKPVEVVERGDNFLRIKFASRAEYRLTLEISALTTIKSTGPDGEQLFFGIFGDTDPAAANPAQLSQDARAGGFAKPVTYLYSPQPLDVQVRLNTQAPLSVSYPLYPDSGWKVRILNPEGMLRVEGQQLEFPSLFWETTHYPVQWDLNDGFCVSRDSAALFLRTHLEAMGFNPREQAECITYWLPVMQRTAYTHIQFAVSGRNGRFSLTNEPGRKYAAAANLDITPAPENILRVLLVIKPLRGQTYPRAQELPRLKRSAFHVLEWGGTVLPSDPPLPREGQGLR